MADTRAASRYVRSLLTLAVEKGVLEEVHQDMLLFAKTCAENRSFALMLRNPIVKHEKKREILQQMFKGKVNEMTMAILDILTRKNREPLLPTIAEDFHTAYNIYNGIGKANVTTAVPLDAGMKAEFEAMVKQISKRDKVELTATVDKDMIGGFILNVGDRQIDASVKNKLKALKVKLSHNPYIKEF